METTRTVHWTAAKLARFSNKHSSGGEIWFVDLYDPREPEYVGSYAATLKPGAFARGCRLFRASHGKDTARSVQHQLDLSSQVSNSDKVS